LFSMGSCLSFVRSKVRPAPPAVVQNIPIVEVTGAGTLSSPSSLRTEETPRVPPKDTKEFPDVQIPTEPETGEGTSAGVDVRTATGGELVEAGTNFLVLLTDRNQFSAP
jgi:hypothetical protein